ncbi:conserved Plasmodium protein, unknown function [Babesia microti strain RI]|uniref:Uncharacterized protein n=1 Tax=Babesia microti (strain RI) TaxID=1133968 RepID=I7J5K9_BABMR|nr:conserved Plasmodium protein, unknown function [Babesia microti strain RI]CCF72977.1 conserved Plasmodium protein, unknown function [Babesia microti strain RI]|eukprot:XP_012647586.1 conserved Plasmodium protein, unknown function [Babesia microti strain RI]
MTTGHIDCVGMDIFNKLPYISLLVSERVWLNQRKNEFADDQEEFERKYLYKDQKSNNSMLLNREYNCGGEEMALDSEITDSNTANDIGICNTSLTKHIELDNVECYEYDPEILESPLSPDGESLGRSSKIGLDVWKWSRHSAPLGYTPPLCTCSNLSMLYQNLTNIQNGQLRVIEQLKVCTDENCSGLLYVPYSLVEVPLNRKIDNAMSFTNHVKIPDHTDIYCGSLKHTLVLCTINLQHENQCLEAIKDAGIEHHLIYDVVNGGDIIPFFTPLTQTNDTILMAERNKASTECKALTLLLDESDDSHSQSAISGQYLITVHKLEQNKLAISKVLKNQYGEFKPLDQHFLETLKRSVDSSPTETATSFASNGDFGTENLCNYSEYKILETTTLKCSMMDSFSKERRPLSLRLRYLPGSNFDTIEDIIGLSANDIASPDKPLKIDNETKQYVIGNLYKLGLSAQLNKEI